ncbi:DUF3025 domain-containing protein [Imbroritus primus]|uniref:DUF3025 domain-containing protein n=1 Tax=Imbroritus primus TaxID=3058603 RepID=UPI0002696E92
MEGALRHGAAPGPAIAAWPGPLADIDWSRPWLAPYRTIGEPLAEAVRSGATLTTLLSAEADCRGLVNAVGRRVHFIAQSELPKGVAYETHIHATGGVPTRDNLHDFFNALIWLHFPQTKARLNAVQAEQIALHGQQVRGAVRDAATLFDENAALVMSADAELHADLRAFSWRRLFVTRRAAWADCRVLIFGHALLEKLVSPYRGITAHAWLTDGPAAPRWPDADLAGALAATPLASRMLTPLPVLGIPGWWSGNSDPAFYADATVFRPGRRDARSARIA